MRSSEYLARALSPALGQALHYFSVPPEQIARALSAQLGEQVAGEIAANYAWLAERPQSQLFVGSAAELAGDLGRPPLSVSAWARTVAWAHAAPAQRAAG